MQFDAIVVGSGPNGLAAAVTLARAGLTVQLFEGRETLGGAARSSELTLPGFVHDECSAIHPQVLSSPFFTAFGIRERMSFVVPDVSYAHPLDGRPAALAFRDVDRTADALGRDGAAWRRLFGPLVPHIDGVIDFTFSQLMRLPRDPVSTVRFGLRALEQGTPAWNWRFRDEPARAMLAGVSAHAVGEMPSLSTAGAGMVLALQAHAAGWPVPVGGSQAIVDALADDFVAHGGDIVTGHMVSSLQELPPARAVLLDVSARGLARIGADHLPPSYLRALESFRYGGAVAKVDFALSGPVPWADENVLDSPTVHLGGTRAEIARSEAQVAAGRHPDHPYVLACQPSLFDSTRAPSGRHTLWAYSHVPNGSNVDVSPAIENQIERFAPGFKDLVIGKAYRSAQELAEYNPNCVGGDFAAGAVTLPQLIRRPVLGPTPWATPLPNVFLASSSTPPGPSVHGLAGFYAARLALKRRFNAGVPDLSPHS